MEARKLASHGRKLTLQEVLPAMVSSGILEPQKAEAILKQSQGASEYPLDTVARLNLRDRRPPHHSLNVETLTQWLAWWTKLPYFEIDPLKMDIKSLTSVLPVAYLRRVQVIPVKVEANAVTFATFEPLDTEWANEVRGTTGKQVQLVVASRRAIKHFLEEVISVRAATVAFKREGSAPSQEFGQVLELDRMLGKAKGNGQGDNAQAVVRVVDWLFKFAYDERATDIHLEPKRGIGQVRFRIDGRMRVVYTFEPELMLPVVSRIKILAEMQVDERRKPQDGRIRYKFEDGREMEMRLSTIPAQHGEKLVVRIFDPKMAGQGFEDLGFQPGDIKKWESLISLPHGLVLVTGPTGSGKSTTLHTSMRQLAQEDVNICTVEGPVEIINEDLNQMQVNTKLEITFGNAIRAFLRQDPDIIMVGEIRDADAGRMAVQAALTGHLVLSTLHTNDAISSITRLMDLEIPPHLIVACLRGMMAQRLVRRLCDHCKEKAPTPIESWKELVQGHPVAPPEQVFVPKGCRECKHSGYSGRICVYEIVLMTPELRDVVRRNVTLDELMEATHGKYATLRESGAQKVIEGLTSLEEVLRVVI
ncbi:MAG: type II/IV secretion system protein [Bdellovibrionales bacterium]|nr:type II/IV secretion system protein [Bdellovibrionales bacterium]